MDDVSAFRPKLDFGHAPGDDTDWAERCTYWLTTAAEKRRGGPPRRQSHEPLRIDHGALVVRSGFTHYPRAQNSSTVEALRPPYERPARSGCGAIVSILHLTVDT
jgi:hypothetical protein